MNNFKKFISVVLALIMMLSVFSITAFASDAAQPQMANVLNFDANSTGWKNFKKVFCHIWVYGGDSFYAWQSKAEACKDSDGDGIWTYDLDSKAVVLEEGELYAVIFSNENGLQTYNLLFDNTVVGDTAYCDGTFFENPEDSTKSAQAAFWMNQDKTVFGPEMCVTSIGNVVGTCVPKTTTTKAMFEDFLVNKLENTRTYSGKADQQIIDDTAQALGLYLETVKSSIYKTGVIVEWKSSKSVLTKATPDQAEKDPEGTLDSTPDQPCIKPDHGMTDGNILHFDTNTTEWTNYKKVFCHIWEYGSDSFYAWQSKAEACADDDGDGVFTYDLDLKGIVLEEGKFYGVIFSNENGVQTYNLLFDTTVLGDTAYCDGVVEQDSPEDSSKEVLFAYWCNQDKTVFGPEMVIDSIGRVIGTAVPAYLYEKHNVKLEMFEDFLIHKLEYARMYWGKADQEIIDDVALALGFQREEVIFAISETGVDTSWKAEDSVLTKATPDQPCIKPDHGMTDGNVLHFDTNTTEWTNYKKVFCHIWEFGGDSFYPWQAKLSSCKDKDGDGIWTYDLKDESVGKDITLEDGKLYAVIFSNENGLQTYPLLFDKTVLGDTAYCDNDIIYESPEDAVKNPTIAFWCNQDKTVFGPELRITSIGTVNGTCVPNTTTPVAMLEEFLENSLDNARVYSGKTDQQLLDDLASALGISDNAVKVAIANAGVEVDWKADENDTTKILGDVDLDGKVTILDATTIQMVRASIMDFANDTAKASADFDGDGVISVMDATTIQLTLAGLI